MPLTKRQIVVAAFEELGITDYEFDLQPQQLESARRRLDSLMAVWNGQGIRLGYPIPATQDGSDLDDSSELPDSANQAAITGLALLIAPSLGKTVSMDTRLAARQGYKLLLARASTPPKMQLPSMPAGAGHKYQYPYRTFTPPPTDPILSGGDGELELN